MQPSPDSFVRSLRAALALDEGESITGELALHPRFVLMIDNYDRLYALHDWLCESLFPELPAEYARGRRQPQTPAGPLDHRSRLARAREDGFIGELFSR